MNPIFNHGSAPQYRLMFVLTLSAAFIFFDHKLGSFELVRGYLQSIVSPLQYIANTPKQFMNWGSENLVTRRSLMDENQRLRIKEIELNEQVMQLDILRKENDRLRALLSSPVKAEMRKMSAEILSVDSDPYKHQVVINRGANEAVYEGQPVLDDKGIVGQVLLVGATSSRVLLISDLTHAIPVRISRNGIRLIASGTGRLDKLELNHVAHSTDIRTGDLLISSGLGGVFPEGYPVATVDFVSQDESSQFARVTATPIAEIDRLRYMLLLWPEKEQSVFSSGKKGKP